MTQRSGARRRTTLHRLAGGALVVASACAGIIVIGAAAAQAAPFFINPNEATPGLLTLETSAWIAHETQGPRQLALGEELVLTPGDTGYWEILATHDDPADSASIWVELTATGTLTQHAEGLRLVFQQCLTPWSGLLAGAPACTAPGGSVTLAPTMASATGYVLDLDAGAAQYMLITATLDGTSAALQGRSAVIGVGLTASATDANVPPEPPGPPLARTGIDTASLLYMLGVGLAAIGVGIGLRMLHPRQRESRSDS